ncbi:MAG: hypothetical protein ACPGOY_13915 [Rhodospirillaceae bacterium]
MTALSEKVIQIRDNTVSAVLEYREMTDDHIEQELLDCAAACLLRANNAADLGRALRAIPFDSAFMPPALRDLREHVKKEMAQ